jgi:hypothetical protein
MNHLARWTTQYNPNTHGSKKCNKRSSVTVQIGATLLVEGLSYAYSKADKMRIQPNFYWKFSTSSSWGIHKHWPCAPGVTRLLAWQGHNWKHHISFCSHTTKNRRQIIKIPQLWPKEKHDAICQQNRNHRSKRTLTSMNYSFRTTAKYHMYAGIEGSAEWSRIKYWKS